MFVFHDNDASVFSSPAKKPMRKTEPADSNCPPSWSSPAFPCIPCIEKYRFSLACLFILRNYRCPLNRIKNNEEKKNTGISATMVLSIIQPNFDVSLCMPELDQCDQRLDWGRWKQSQKILVWYSWLRSVCDLQADTGWLTFQKAFLERSHNHECAMWLSLPISAYRKMLLEQSM